MIDQEKAEYLRGNLPDERYIHYCKLNNARGLLYVHGILTESENRKARARLEKKAMEEARKWK